MNRREIKCTNCTDPDCKNRVWIEPEGIWFEHNKATGEMRIPLDANNTLELIKQLKEMYAGLAND